jgi:hypothetical protein
MTGQTGLAPGEFGIGQYGLRKSDGSQNQAHGGGVAKEHDDVSSDVAGFRPSVDEALKAGNG